MTKTEALEALALGKILTHTSFNEFESIERGPIGIEFEDGCQCTDLQFWNTRLGPEWDTSWSEFEEV